MNGQIRVLLVDDEALFRDTTRRLLTRRGYHVITAENGQMALDALSETVVDVVLLDLKMPGLGGEEALGIIGTQHPDVPVIIITGHGNMDIAVACMKKGACDFVVKPFDVEALLIAIESAQEKKKLKEKTKQSQDELIRTLFDFNTEKKRLKTIINCLANGVMVTNENLEVILHNPALMRLLGISERMQNPFPVTRITTDDSLLEALKKILSEGFPENEMISQEIIAGNNVLRAISAPALGPSRNVFWSVVGTVTVFEDITAFKQLDQMKSDFVNMVAHELRSPLVSVRQLNSVLLEGLAGPLGEKQGEFVSRGTQKIDALLELINDLLDVARIEAGRHVQHQVPTDVSRILKEIVALMAPRASAQGIVLTCSCGNLKPVQADPRNIEEVFNNLITNAINYSPQGGSVTVTAELRGEHVEIKVEDTGVGIPPEELPKIFDKFYRVKHPKTRQVTGTGLGLSIVKGVVEAHHGTITVESVLDKGTVFRILLPVIP
jgi:signal transduction histidine kinase/ActR/RegA family two-component response regulator